MKYSFTIGFIGKLLAAVTSVYAQSASPLGYWKTEEGKAKVHIYDCGPHTVCGKIIDLKEPLDENGQPKKDPEGKPIKGMQIMKDCKQQSSHEWGEGTIYDPKEGKAYDALFILSENANQISLRGYVVFSFIGRTQNWQRTTLNAPLNP